jgi:hypothetical protein
MLDELAELVAKLAIRLSTTVPDTDLYEQRSAELKEWLLIFGSWVDSDQEDALG